MLSLIQEDQTMDIIIPAISAISKKDSRAKIS